MSDHSHRQYIEGCFRCDLARDERPTTLPDFLLDRIAEDEAVARDAVPTGWVTFRQPDGSMSHTALGTPEDDGGWIVDGRLVQDERAEVFYDPARVLAECEAKRRIVEHFRWVINTERVPTDRPGVYDRRSVYAYSEEGEDVFRLLALPYAGHPDYNEEWRA
jgi:hypothetical protein